MAGYWISFGIIAGLILLGIISLRKIALSNPNIEITPKIKRTANLRAVLYLSYWWSWDLFYMAHFINNLPCKFVFGSIIIAVVFMALGPAFAYPKEKSWFERINMLQLFVFGIALTIYLIYLIPDTTLQAVVIPIIAAVYGGLITLAGVSLTIKKSDKDRKEDRIKEAKPYFSYNMLRKEPTLDFVVQRICLSDTSETNIYSCEVYVELENSNLSLFEIKRIYHDHDWVGVEGNTIVLPSAKCLLSFRFNDNPEHIFLEVEDVLSIRHYYQLKVLAIGSLTTSGKFMHTIREIKELTEDKIKDFIEQDVTHK